MVVETIRNDTLTLEKQKQLRRARVEDREGLKELVSEEDLTSEVWGYSQGQKVEAGGCCQVFSPELPEGYNLRGVPKD